MIFVVGVSSSSAQTKRVTGQVTSIGGKETLPGVNVFIKESPSTGTITDIDGKYEIKSLPAGAKTIVFSFIGMKTAELPITGESINAQMEPDNQQIEEVVVTGYGTYKKQAFTGSASTIDSRKTMDVPTVSIENKLAGAVSGVSITSTSGQPGSVQSVSIRGMGSMNAGNQPLYVIDGVPMMTGNASGFSYDQAGSSLLSTLNASDIENMTVIKDAAAASLYGSRAANGVIVITTKKGKAGKTKFNVKSDWGFSDMAIDYRPTLNGEDRYNMLYLGLVNYAKNNPGKYPNPTEYADANINSYAAKPWSGYTSWEDHLLQKGMHQNYEVSANGGNENTNFYTSLSYTDQKGITLNSDFERVTGRLNLNHKSGKFNMGANITFASTSQDVNTEGTSYANPIMQLAMTISPSSYPYNEDGTYATYFPALNKDSNPLQASAYNYNNSKIIRTQNSVFAGYEIIEGLSVKETVSLDFNNTNNSVWWDPRFGDGKGSKGVMQKYMFNRMRLTSQTMLNYAKTFNEVHSFDALAAYEVEDNRTEMLYGSGTNFPSFQRPEIGNAPNTRASSNLDKHRMVSYVGRINYSYDNKYYLGGSFRRDGTSRLAPDTRWGNFWSASASWIFTEEGFMDATKSFLSNGKLRLSYGVNGTQPNDLYGYMALFGYGYNYNGNPGSAEDQLANPNLTWEKNYSTNIGLDFTLFNRLSIVMDWYNRDTKDLIMDLPVSQTTGFQDYLVNIGQMNNRGFEFEITSRNITRSDFSWTTSLNLTHNKNKITQLDGKQTEIIDGLLIHKIGSAYNTFYLREYAGVDPQTGKELFYKNDGSGGTTTNPALAKYVERGSVDPKISGGINNSLRWKFIDLNFTFTYSLGGKAYDNASWLQSNGGTYNYLGNVPSYYADGKMWTGPGDTQATLPQFAYGNSAVVSDRWLKSTNHLRLKNLTLGVSIPEQWIDKSGFNKVRVYFTGTNLFTVKSKDLYFDPEVPTNGIVTFASPALRTLAFGIDLAF